LAIDEKNDNLKQVYKEKMSQFLDRAEYIKKTALNAPEHQVAPQEPTGGAGGSAAAKPKPKQK
jgi:hypothetical protein